MRSAKAVSWSCVGRFIMVSDPAIPCLSICWASAMLISRPTARAVESSFIRRVNACSAQLGLDEPTAPDFSKIDLRGCGVSCSHGPFGLYRGTGCERWKCVVSHRDLVCQSVDVARAEVTTERRQFQFCCILSENAESCNRICPQQEPRLHVVVHFAGYHRVLDLTQIYNGPYATFLLAQAGAEVIKIEPPAASICASARARAARRCRSAMLNANKRTMTLNLKSTRGRELLLRWSSRRRTGRELRPGVMDRLNSARRCCATRTHRLIYASGSGYGKAGPYRDFYLAMDLTVRRRPAWPAITSMTGWPRGAASEADWVSPRPPTSWPASTSFTRGERSPPLCSVRRTCCRRERRTIEISKLMEAR